MNRAQLRDRIERLEQGVAALKRQHAAQGRPSAVDGLVSAAEAENHIAAFGKAHPRLSPLQRELATADAAEYRRRYGEEPPAEWLRNRRLSWDLYHELIERGIDAGNIRAVVGSPDPDSNLLEEQELLIVADVCDTFLLAAGSSPLATAASNWRASARASSGVSTP